MGEEKGVKLFGAWGSPFSLRVEWALRLKGVEYEYVNDENLPHTNPELLHYNPITKKVPTLVHDGRPLAESLVIIEYVDEVWNDPYHPIMPQDPYQKAQARFWATFVEDKCLLAFIKVYSTAGKELHVAVREAQETLRTLETALEGKRFFGGDEIGYLDIIAGWYAIWIPMIEDIDGVSIVNDDSLPSLNAWFHRFTDLGLVKERSPPKDKLYALYRDRREQFITGEISYKK